MLGGKSPNCLASAIPLAIATPLLISFMPLFLEKIFTASRNVLFLSFFIPTLSTL